MNVNTECIGSDKEEISRLKYELEQVRGFMRVKTAAILYWKEKAETFAGNAYGLKEEYAKVVAQQTGNANLIVYLEETLRYRNERVAGLESLVADLRKAAACSEQPATCSVHGVVDALNSEDDGHCAIAKAVLALGDTLIAKNTDYGSSVWCPPELASDVSVPEAIMVRLSDKFNRLATLRSRQDQAVSDESELDTVMDIAGYCVLYKVYADACLDCCDDGCCED